MKLFSWYINLRINGKYFVNFETTFYLKVWNDRFENSLFGIVSLPNFSQWATIFYCRIVNIFRSVELFMSWFSRHSLPPDLLFNNLGQPHIFSWVDTTMTYRACRSFFSNGGFSNFEFSVIMKNFCSFVWSRLSHKLLI